MHTVESLYFVGAQFSRFSWIPSTTNLHPQQIMLYNKQKLNQCKLRKTPTTVYLQSKMPIRKANLGLDSVNYKINYIVCPKR